MRENNILYFDRFAMNEQVANVKFVKEVEKHPVLYNYNLPGYSRKDCTDKAWNEISKTVKLTANECKEKWRNLRTVFTRHMKPSAESNARKRRAYYLADMMQFCAPYIKVINPETPKILRGLLEEELHYRNEGQPKEEPEISGSSENEYNDINASLTAESSFPETSPAQEIITPFPSPSPSTSSRATSQAAAENDEFSGRTFTSRTKKKNLTHRWKTEVEADKSIADYFKAKTAKLQDSSRLSNAKNQALKMFLLSLMSDLQQFDDRQLRLFKCRTLATIDEIATSSSSHTSTASSLHELSSVVTRTSNECDAL